MIQNHRIYEEILHYFGLKLDDQDKSVKRVEKDWRISIESSEASFKCVQLHDSNVFPSILIGYSEYLKKKYNFMTTILEKMCYEEHNWTI